MNLLKEIVIHTGLGASDVRRIISRAPKTYKEYPIPKRSGGHRIIAQPSRELKILQRFLMDHLLADLPVHSAAMAYVKNRNIFDNANAHRGGSAILKLDFESFFHSIRVSDWIAYVRKNRPDWDRADDLSNMVKILFWGRGSSRPKCLSIGAPTSPMISNIIMYDLDTMFIEEATRSEAVYTRYADDITISGDSLENIISVENFIRTKIRKTRHPKLKFNESKRGVYTRGQRRLVTGLILTPEGNISIGRDRKRAVSALIHKFSLKLLNWKEVGYLKGMLGFTIANEPQFINRMRRKYGDDVIDRILQIQIPSRLEMANNQDDNVE